jgi:hypothetical protein
MSGRTDHPALSAALATALAAALATGAAAVQSAPAPDAIPVPRVRAPRMPSVPAAQAAPIEAIGPDGASTVVSADAAPPALDGVRAALLVGRGLAPLGMPGQMVLVLADGQRLVGSPATSETGTVWVSPWVAPVPLALDGVRAVILSGARAPAVADEDVVELRNGDRATGVVTALTMSAVSVERASGDERTTVDVPLDEVAAIGLVGPAAPRTGMRAWLADGSVLDAPRFEWSGEDYLVAAGVRGARTGALTVPRRMLVGVQSSPDGARALASMPAEAVKRAGSEGAREWIPAPRAQPGTWVLDAPPLEVEGPVVLRYPALGSPATLRMTVRRPPTALEAGSPDLVVRSGGREVLRERLSPDRPEVALSAALSAGPFEVELASADGSLAGNFAVLERALVVPASSGLQPSPSQR